MDRSQDMIDYQHDAEILKALGHPTRLQIVDAIRGGQVCVTTLEELTGASQSCVSQHLSILRNLGLVNAVREGNLICYSLNHRLADRIIELLRTQNNNNSGMN